jgi:hypothetical protein
VSKQSRDFFTFWSRDVGASQIAWAAQLAGSYARLASMAGSENEGSI